MDVCRDAMAETEEELTPLKKKLDDFGTFLSKVPPALVMLGVCVTSSESSAGRPKSQRLWTINILL